MTQAAQTAETKHDGGPAFPLSWTETNAYGVEFPMLQSSMNLRDWFAGQALVGIAQDRNARSFTTAGQEAAKWMAQQAYDLADAMLAARAVQS